MAPKQISLTVIYVRMAQVTLRTKFKIAVKVEDAEGVTNLQAQVYSKIINTLQAFG